MAVIPSNKLSTKSKATYSPDSTSPPRATADLTVMAGGGPLDGGLLTDKTQPAKVGRMLSYAQQIRSTTNQSGGGGASADLRTLKPYEPGQKVHMVGGTNDDRTKQAFPTQLVDVGSTDPHMTMHDVFSAREKMMAATPGRKAAVFGTWNEPGYNRIDIDLSTAFTDRTKAEDMTMSRNEDAMFSMENMEETSNEDIRAKRGKGPRKPKDKKQEEIARRHGE